MAPNISRILVPMDFSEHSDTALRYATTLARQVDASLHLLHVVDTAGLLRGWAGEVYFPNMPELEVNLVTDAEKRLDERRRAAEAESLSVTATVRVGHVVTRIIEFASEERSDLIVIGTHGRTGLAHLLIGSVAERVIRMAPCPVLTVRGTALAEAAGTGDRAESVA